jgi:ubiquinone/menaquinone biosynthesis C-methylase UbiE
MSGRANRKSLRQRLTEELIWLDSKYTHPPWHNLLVKEIFSHALDKKDKIIEIGCGAGGLCRKLARIVTEGGVVGTDISEGYIERLRWSMERDDSAPKNLVFRHGSAENIPYPDSTFDHAVSAGSFSFWSQPERGLAEVGRVLKPGGKLHIADVCAEEPIWLTGGVRLFNLCSPYKMNIYSSEKFREFLREAGFTGVQQRRGLMGTLVTTGTRR